MRPLPYVTDYPFIQARNYTKSQRKDIKTVVMHSMESPEKPNVAMAVANWFAGPSAPRASAHYCIDATEVVQCVHLSDVAWHAPGCNSTGVGVELSGYANQSAGDWGDDYSDAELGLAARVVAEVCWMYDIPVVWLEPDALKRGERGITSHSNVSIAFRKSTHTDPGKGFPRSEFLADVFRHVQQIERLALQAVEKPVAPGTPPVDNEKDEPIPDTMKDPTHD